MHWRESILQTNYSNNQLVLQVNTEGYIDKITLNTYQDLEVKIGTSAIHLFSDDSKQQYYNQFSQVLKEGSTNGLRVLLENSMEGIVFFLKQEEEIILIVLSLLEDVTHLLGDLLAINNLQTTTLRRLTKKISKNSDTESLFNEMMFVNNELINVRRELSQTNQKLHKANLELERITFTDYLTQLPNRRKFFKDVYPLVQAENHILTMMDFNNFKAVNDELGHDKGDELLLYFATTITNKCKPYNAQMYRLGGDEFCILHKAHVDLDLDTIIQEVDQLIQSYHPQISIAYGSVTLTKDNTNDSKRVETMMHQADMKMFENKRYFHQKHNIKERRKKGF